MLKTVDKVALIMASLAIVCSAAAHLFISPAFANMYADFGGALPLFSQVTRYRRQGRLT